MPRKHKKRCFIYIHLQSQSILKTPPSIFAFMPAGRTQWMGEPPWLDSDDRRAKPTCATKETRLNLRITAQKDSSGIRYECTLEFATLPDRKDQDNTSSCAERCVQFLLIHWQRGPNTLKVTGKNMRLPHFTRFFKPNRLTLTETYLGFSK